MVINFTTSLRPFGGKIKDFAFTSLEIDELYKPSYHCADASRAFGESQTSLRFSLTQLAHLVAKATRLRRARSENQTQVFDFHSLS